MCVRACTCDTHECACVFMTACVCACTHVRMCLYEGDNITVFYCIVMVRSLCLTGKSISYILCLMMFTDWLIYVVVQFDIIIVII